MEPEGRWERYDTVDHNSVIWLDTRISIEKNGAS